MESCTTRGQLWRRPTPQGRWSELSFSLRWQPSGTFISNVFSHLFQYNLRLLAFGVLTITCCVCVCAAMLAHSCSFVIINYNIWQHLFVIVLRECLQCRQGLSDILGDLLFIYRIDMGSWSSLQFRILFILGLRCYKLLLICPRSFVEFLVVRVSVLAF